MPDAVTDFQKCTKQDMHIWCPVPTAYPSLLKIAIYFSLKRYAGSRPHCLLVSAFSCLLLIAVWLMATLTSMGGPHWKEFTKWVVRAWTLSRAHRTRKCTVAECTCGYPEWRAERRRTAANGGWRRQKSAQSVVGTGRKLINGVAADWVGL